MSKKEIMQKFEKIGDMKFTKSPQTIKPSEMIRKMREKNISGYDKIIKIDGRKR